MKFFFWLTFCLLFPFHAFSAETSPVKKPGIKVLQLVSDHNAVVPGSEISVGLFIQHQPEYHTYWKAPGIVGVPTTIDWELPEGFSASGIEWPVPELTKMAQYDCYGYEQDVCLITRITVPVQIDTDYVKIKARVAFMCCAKTCHPGWHDFELTLPVARKNNPGKDKPWERVFAENRKRVAIPAPEGWAVLTNDGEKDQLEISITQIKHSFPVPDAVYCFCENNQIHSDSPQQVVRSKDRKNLTLSLVKSEFATDNLKQFSGLLYCLEGWPGLSTKWVRITAPLPNPIAKN